MTKLVNLAVDRFDSYYKSFGKLNPEQIQNMEIKYDHSYRVADLCYKLSSKLDWSEEERTIAYVTGLFHDIGRFKQLAEFNTFNDTQSVDHAEYSVEVLTEQHFLDELDMYQKSTVLTAINLHNKRQLPGDLSADEMKFAALLRDADKLDILNVLTDYYTNQRSKPNHTLTWEMPKGTAITPVVARQALNNLLVAKENVANQLDIKVMQLSWVFDLNFKPSFQLLIEKRFLEKIYGTMPKNDTVIQIYRTIKVYTENKMLS